MGFFQDLKEDLSQAVNELLPEEEAAAAAQEAAQAQETVEDNGVDLTMKEVEEALTAQLKEEPLISEMAPGGQQEQAEQTENEPEPIEEEPIEEEPIEEEPEQMDEEPKQESTEETEPVGDEEPLEKAAGNAAWDNAQNTPADTSFQPVKDAAAAQLKGIANIVAKEEPVFEEQQEMGIEDEFEERQLQSPEELLSAIGQQAEETELEKEVGKAMAEQKMNLEEEQVADETALITAGMSITGDISSKGSMDVLGNVKGNIEVLGKLNISGHIEGDSKAAEIFADSAHITGKITAEGTVKIGQNSVIIGDIAASSAVIAGAVKGDIDVMGPVILDASAIVMGNIKSKSVQINNGAVIEGMCSQCYAEVNPTSFFDELVSK